MHGQTPTLVLIPKHLMWLSAELPAKPKAVPLGKARIVQEGTAVTLVAWGNCVEVAEQALAAMGADARQIELIDLRSIVPLDFETIRASVAKTRRLLVVQEDGETKVSSPASLEIQRFFSVWWPRRFCFPNPMSISAIIR